MEPIPAEIKPTYIGGEPHERTMSSSIGYQYSSSVRGWPRFLNRSISPQKPAIPCGASSRAMGYSVSSSGYGTSICGKAAGCRAIQTTFREGGASASNEHCRSNGLWYNHQSLSHTGGLPCSDSELWQRFGERIKRNEPG